MNMSSSQRDTEWTVEVTSTFKRDLSQLPEKVAVAVVEFVLGPLQENPYRLSGPLHAELAGKRSAKRGHYRVLIEIDDESQIVYLLNVDHRAHVYRRR